MGNKRTALGVAILGLALAGWGAYRSRRRWIGRVLGLRPAQHDVIVERNIRVPMPDGVTLATDHYLPKSAGSFPTILIRTPYGLEQDGPPPFSLMTGFPAQRFAERGYHVVVQSTRGRFASQGEFVPFVNEAADGRATLEWISGQPWFDGALGMWGASYLGYVQWAVAADAPPYLKALVPYITGSNLASLTYPDGALGLDTFLHWTFLITEMGGAIKRPTLETLRRINPFGQARFLASAVQHLPLGEADVALVGQPVPWLREWLAHPNLDDPIWKLGDHSAGVPRVTAPIHLLSGWYDLILRELLADYTALKAAGKLPYLTIGPWFHVHPMTQLEAEREGLAWFDTYLKGEQDRLRPQPVRIFVMGANEWREMDDWPPPARETRYYLRDQRLLSTDLPEAGSPADHYRYDPADPTPNVGGPLLNPPAGPMDNRALEARSDVLCYTSRPLVSDVDAIGPVRLELYVRSSLAHTDFFGRLCDVHPDGRSINICDGLFRIEPGKGTPQPDGSLKIEIGLSATANRFRRGHRIRLQVSSGAHPRWSRNLGTGEPIASGTRMLVAEQTVYHDRAHPSALVLPVTAA